MEERIKAIIFGGLAILSLVTLIPFIYLIGLFSVLIFLIFWFPFIHYLTKDRGFWTSVLITAISTFVMLIIYFAGGFLFRRLI